jgi:Mg2+/Co2+ transporter CorB
MVDYNNLYILLTSLVVLIWLSNLFSMMEASVLSSNEESIIHKSAQGIFKSKKRVQMISEMLSKKDKIVSAILFANNVANISASTIAVLIANEISVLANIDLEVTIFISTSILTFVVFVVGEALPKTLAIHKPEQIYYENVIFINVLTKLLTPFLVIVNFVIIIICRVFGVKKAHNNKLSVEEELRLAIESKYIQGKVVNEDRQMLSSILELGDVEVCDIMTHRKDVFAVDIQMDISDIVKKIFSTSHSRIPVYRDNFDKIVGVLYIKDLWRHLELENADDKVKFLFENFDKTKLVSCLHKPNFAPSNTRLKTQLYNFRKSRNHMSFVVDEYGGVMGLITLEDVLEEIVGEIVDEHENPNNQDEFKVDKDGDIIVEGDFTIRDFNKAFETNFDDDESSTMAGLVIDKIERIPNKGEEIMIDGFKITILENSGSRITKLKVSKNEVNFVENEKI